MTQALFLTIKPQSLLISIVSASVGVALAALYGPVHWGIYGLTLLGVVLLHAGANVMNDYFDYKNKVDTAEVPGSYSTEARVLVQKGMTPFQVLFLGLFLSGLSLPIGLYLTLAKGWPVFLIGFLGFLTGLCYTARPIALKYIALGEPAVFLMWGPLMVSGAYYVQRESFSSQAIWVSVPVGILVALIVLANNIRDTRFDGQVGIHTVATRLGQRSAIRLYQTLMALVYGVTVLLVIVGSLSPWAFLTLLTLPLSLTLMKMLSREVPIDADARTAQLDTAFGVLLILSMILERFVS